MNTRFLALALLAPLAGTMALSSDAHACGGCVVPPETNTIVNAHRMALSISPTQTVLWDQIQYKGDPQSWGWLLPVKPGARIELSTDAWFETLDAATTTNVTAPSLSCGSGVACGDVQYDALPGDASNGGVQVIHRGTVGPFDTVTLDTSTPDALQKWLTDAGFNVPADSTSVIDAYVKEGFNFIALKLQPDKNVDEMKPVRVIQEGANPTLPLRMVSVGSGANVAITLYIIGEGRWEAKNFKNTQVPIDLLAWDFNTNSSNYSELREKVLAENGGNVWLTTYARQRALMSPLERSFTINNSFTNFTNVIGEAYVQQGIQNGETTDRGCSSTFSQFANSAKLVVNPCPPDVPPYDTSCKTMVGVNEIDRRLFECGATDEVLETTLDDIATALTGLHPNDVWVTRLEANLPRAALLNDLEITAAANQIEMSADLQARLGKNACGSSTIAPIESLPSNDDRGRMLVLVSMIGATLLAVARKKTRSTQWIGAT